MGQLIIERLFLLKEQLDRITHKAREIPLNETTIQSNPKTV